MLQLPTELLFDILIHALDAHPCPSDVFCVHSQLNTIGSRVLYSHLHFRSVRQLKLFTQDRAPLPCAAREIRIILPGGTVNFDVFRHMQDVFRRCLEWSGNRGERLPLELLSLRLHSHTSNPNLRDIHGALILVDPKSFAWLGPDPGHHFSTAIVPAATSHLFQAISTWTSVAHIVITSISFPNDAVSPGEALDPWAPLLPTMPSLRSFCLGQATFLPPTVIVAMMCLEDQPSLERVRLVDTYGDSIWGRRIRRSDVEKAVAILGILDQKAALERIRRIVRCEVQNERVIGGDRAEGLEFLE